MSRRDDRGERSWERVKQDLLACRNAELREWGELDDLLVARYLAGKLDKSTEAAVKDAIAHHPRLKECVDLLRLIEIEKMSVTVGREPCL